MLLFCTIPIYFTLLFSLLLLFYLYCQLNLPFFLSIYVFRYYFSIIDAHGLSWNYITEKVAFIAGHIWGTFGILAFQFISVTMVCISKLAARRAKTSENWHSGALWVHISRTFIWPCWVQCHFGVMRCTCLKIVYISNMAGCTANRSEMCGSWILASQIWVIFDLVRFNVILWGH